MKNNKILLPIAAAILVSGFLLFGLEKIHVTNFYEKPVSALKTGNIQQVNSVDYTAQSTPPDPSVNTEKNTDKDTASSNNSTNNVSIVITRANQDQITKNLNIGTLVNGVSSGECNLTLSRGGNVVVANSAALFTQNNLTTCAGFTIAGADIPANGTYELKISIGSVNSTQSVELTK